MSLFDLLRGQAVSAGQLRQEIYLLGGRHRGDALAGALLELKERDLSSERRALLRAVVRHLARGRPTPDTATVVENDDQGPPRAGLGDLVYLGVIVAAAGWVLMVLNGLAG
jgi:hypothetical protein